MALHAPELLILYALDMFLVLSIVTVLFDSNFPMAVPYFFQLLSIAGTGHLYVSQVFKEMFSLDSRFWYSFFYLDAMILSALAVSAYLFFLKKSISSGLMFFGGFSLPSASFGLYLITFYDNYSSVPMIFSTINGNWIGVLMLVSFMFFMKGAKLFAKSDPRFNEIQLNIRKKTFHVLGKVEDQTEPIKKEQTENKNFNPVDHVYTNNNLIIDPDQNE